MKKINLNIDFDKPLFKSEPDNSLEKYNDKIFAIRTKRIKN